MEKLIEFIKVLVGYYNVDRIVSDFDKTAKKLRASSIHHLTKARKQYEEARMLRAKASAANEAAERAERIQQRLNELIGS
jgi:hypothetical protein